ncbi:MAG: hypothetical protein KGR69_11795, partial [Verrucomicrobia bacterium]|nr:hypothetical protein [Verrucomicrobiota bacterium]
MNSELPSAPESLSLLGRFHDGAIGFAEREKGLERARQLRESGRRQTLEEERAAAARRRRAEIDALRDATAVTCASLEETARKRRARVDRAQIQLRNATIAAIQAVEGQHRAGLQR